MSLAFNIVALTVVGLFVAVFAAVPVARWRERRGPGGMGRRLTAAIGRAWTAARQWAENTVGPDPKPTCGWHVPADGIGAPSRTRLPEDAS